MQIVLCAIFHSFVACTAIVKLDRTMEFAKIGVICIRLYLSFFLRLILSLPFSSPLDNSLALSYSLSLFLPLSLSYFHFCHNLKRSHHILLRDKRVFTNESALNIKRIDDRRNANFIIVKLQSSLESI